MGDAAQFAQGLRGSSAYGAGLVRFRPFDLHPNLTGFIFGAGALLLYGRAREVSGLARVAFGLCAALSLGIVLAASARAGLVALAGALVIGMSVQLHRLRPRGALALMVVGLVCGGLFRDEIAAYAIRILDLASETRGFGSGATGRTELWGQGLQLLASRDPFTLVFGSGLRSSSAAVVGFSTESSYITLLLEQGLALGGLLILAIVWRAGAHVRRGARGDRRAMLIGQLLCFALIQSVFNRYLLAVGNPFSLYLMLLFLQAHHQEDEEWPVAARIRAARPGRLIWRG